MNNICGIIGRISLEKNPELTLKGLEHLEYRGYDSYGILLSDKNTQTLCKNTGSITKNKIAILKEITSSIEIGHTRWATHGKADINNAHPHFDNKKEFFVVMNGIIENYREIKDKFPKEIFKTETDTEIIPILYQKLFSKQEKNLSTKNKLLNITKSIIRELTGEYSFLVRYKNFLIAYKNSNPIVIGKKENKEIYISSDSELIQNNYSEYYSMNDEDIAIIKLEKNEVKLNTYGKSTEKVFKFSKSVKQNNSIKKIKKYYMEQEILEQGKIFPLTAENLNTIQKLKKDFCNKKIIISAAGTSYHAGIVLHYKLLELGIMSQTIVASELKNYSGTLKDCLIIVLSQSGETADLIYPLKELKKKNKIISIINTKNSTIENLSKKSIYLNCGKEIAVASTKAFTSQLFVIELIKEILKEKINLNTKKYYELFNIFIKESEKQIEKVVNYIATFKDVFFIGRNLFYPIALEGALKLKEISYIHAEGFAGGELKHGSLALISEGTPCIVLNNDKEILSNAREIKSRGGKIIGISNKYSEVYDLWIKIPEYAKEIFTTISLQLIAMNSATKLGKNPDKPRNLAKSVTVK